MLTPAKNTEAVRALVRVLFTHVRVETVAATVRTINPASRRVLEKNGFDLV
ncbi:MAG TPA: GNAT family N-acetyltransferase, partial [bacterium]|nr:GNAT family N-acetyltransferase [bacterium]